MCHLILLLPVLGLPLFWLLPLTVAAEAYAGVVAVSVAIYWLVIRAMVQPVTTGAEELSREIGRVVSTNGPKGTLRIHGELWQYRSDERLQPGDTVRVAGREGLTLRVERVAQPAAGIAAPPDDAPLAGG